MATTVTKCYQQARGKVIRATRLDSCGDPVPSQSAVSVSDRVSQITFDRVTEDAENIRTKNFGGKLMAVDDGFAELVGYTGDINFVGVDPGLVTLLTGQPPVKNAKGEVVGFDIDGGVDLDGFGYSLEVWTRIIGAACRNTNGFRNWGYTVAPFFKGGMLGEFTVEDGAVDFQITGAQTREGNGWGVGPYDVDRNAAGQPSPLFTPLGSRNHFRNTLVTLEPPVASCGTFPLTSA